MIYEKLSSYVWCPNAASKHSYRHEAPPPKPRTRQSTPLPEPSYHVNDRTATPLVVVPQDAPAPEDELVYTVNVVQPLGYYISVNMTSNALSLGQLWCDAGCARGSGFVKQHAGLAHVHRQLNLCAVVERLNDTFSSWKWRD